MERLTKLESSWATPPYRRPTGTSRQDSGKQNGKSDLTLPKKAVVCFKCGNEGHFAKGCATPQPKNSGNWWPSAPRAGRVRGTLLRRPLNLLLMHIQLLVLSLLTAFVERYRTYLSRFCWTLALQLQCWTILSGKRSSKQMMHFNHGLVMYQLELVASTLRYKAPLRQKYKLMITFFLLWY